MEDVNVVRILHDVGMTTVELAKLVGVSRQTLDKAKKQFEETGNATNEMYNMIFSLLKNENDLDRDKIIDIVTLVLDFINMRNTSVITNSDTTQSLQLKNNILKLLNLTTLSSDNMSDYDNKVINKVLKGISREYNRTYYRALHEIEMDNSKSIYTINGKEIGEFYRSIERAEIDMLKMMINRLNHKGFISKVEMLKYDLGSVIEGTIIEINDNNYKVQFELGMGYIGKKELTRIRQDFTYEVGQKVKGRVSLDGNGSIKLIGVQLIWK